MISFLFFALVFLVPLPIFLPNNNDANYTDDCPMLPSSDGPFGNASLPKIRCHDPECQANNFTGTGCSFLDNKSRTLGSDWRDSATLRGEAATPWVD